MKKPKIVVPLLIVSLLMSTKVHSNQKDSLLNELSVISNPDQRYNILHRLYEISYRDNYYEAEKYVITALGISNQVNNYHYMITSYKRLAKLYEQQNILSRAYVFFLEARKIAETRDCVEELPELNYHIGVVLYKLGRFNESLTFLETALSMVATQNNPELTINATLFSTFALYRNGEKKQTLRQLKILEERAARPDSVHLRAFIYFYLQGFYKDIFKNKTALILNDKAYSLFLRSNDRYHALLCMKDRASIYTSMKDPQKVIAQYRKILLELDTLQKFSWLNPVILDSLSGFYAHQNDPILSHYYARKSEKGYDSLMVSVKPLILKIPGIITDTDHENAKNKRFSIFDKVIALLLLLMTAAIIIIIRRYKKIKRTIKIEQEIAMLKARLQAEEEKQLALELANRMIDEKKEKSVQKASEMAVHEAREIIEKAKEEARMLQAEVTTTSVLLANKNDYLLQLQEKLKTTDDSELRRLAKEIKNNLGDTDHWANYIKNFNLLHSRFLDRLTKKHPDLTASEIKLICFVITGLSNKEIAGIFSVEPESVKKARYRLKKKLHIPEEENLNTYLLGMQ